MNIEKLYALYLQHPSIQTDTRKLQKGDIFFALKGDNFDGNSFAFKALEAGAAYAVVDDASVATNDKIILADDVLTVLQQLAKHHRMQFNIPFIAITGSNGKTTTKELVHAVLNTTYKAYTTKGNFNNHIGIPLTILSVKKDAAFAIIEMGANHQKEIEGYCTYTLPTHGIITNCGKAHLEGFGGVEGVRKGKGELYDYLRKNNGTAFVMWDYGYLQHMSNGILHIIKYGTNNEQYAGVVKQSEPFLEVDIKQGMDVKTLQTQLVGDYNLPNVLVAIAVGKHFNINDDKIKKAIEAYAPSNSRSQMLQKDGNHIILDAYNANPTSMKAAIENFSKIHAPNKVVLLGSMAEMGTHSEEEHATIINLLNRLNFKEVVLVGDEFKKIKHSFVQLNNATEAKEWLQLKNFKNAHILIKGSRSMQMEKVLE
jgi:UDP-N-acetylmuramoyl-tripeptide--D-alanyl-D-alanine ligase